MTSSARAACSTLTCSSVRSSGSIVVIRSSSASISPRPFSRAKSFLWFGFAGEELVLGVVVLQVDLPAPHLGRVQRRLAQVHAAGSTSGFICRKKNVSSSVRMC